MKLQATALFSLTVATANAQLKTDNKTGFVWDPEHFKVAAVRYPPYNYAYPIAENRTWVDLDLNKTIDKAIEFINQAGSEGVKFMGFPELYFPGFPIALNYNFTPPNFSQYASQSMVWEGPEWKRLTAAFAANKMYAVVSFSERVPAEDALYMGQYLIGPDGKTIHKHRKLRPSGSERNLFSDGVISSIRAIPLPFGTVTFLSCWENLWPSMRYMAASQPAHLHIASFPFCAGTNENTEWWEHCEGFQAVVRTYTQEAGVAAIMPAIGKVRIWGTYGVPGVGNSSDLLDEASFEAIPYITAELNTTTWTPLSYDVNGQHSWAALMQLVSGMAPELPREWGFYFNHYVNKISDLAKYYVFPVSLGSSVANSSTWPSLYENYGQTSKEVFPEQYI